MNRRIEEYEYPATGTRLLVGSPIVAELREMLSGRKVVVIADKAVAGSFNKHFPTIEIEAGEENKTLASLEPIYRRLVEENADRKTFIIGAGGGVVCDIAGFVASTFMRGVDFGLVPTTVLAQADASIGGKNGVNLAGLKNMVGTFCQPSFVACDTEFLGSLPMKEYCNGFAEIIKMAVIRDAGLLGLLEEYQERLLNHDQKILRMVILRCASLKFEIVSEDIRENGLRTILNFGHSFGHALQSISTYTHGQAVSIGMIIASSVSEQICHLNPSVTARIASLLEAYRLPVSCEIPATDMIGAIHSDKKREGDNIRFVLLENIAAPVIKTLPVDDLRLYL